VKVLLDENLPRRLRDNLPGHDVFTVTWMRWKGVKNGRLLDLAEQEAFEVFVTMDRRLPYQQNLGNRTIGVIVLLAADNQEETILPMPQAILEALQAVRAGEAISISGT
jgi:predicted nuclease of predicted toxin-antitoxin system